jgi:hypothetical protein
VLCLGGTTVVAVVILAAAQHCVVIAVEVHVALVVLRQAGLLLSDVRVCHALLSARL